MSEVCDYSLDWIASWLGARPWPSDKRLLQSRRIIRLARYACGLHLRPAAEAHIR